MQRLYRKSDIHTMADLFRNRYRVPSARAPWWDYGRDAAYFVTICTQGHTHFFGEVEKDKMRLTEIGTIAHDCWQEIPDHFPFVHLHEFVVMPNHVHGIVIIDRYGYAPPVETLHDTPVETLHATSLPTSDPPPPKNEEMAALSPKSGSLSTIIRSYKSAVSKQARAIHADFTWQARFHDRIIRDAQGHEKIRYYIINNPRLWEKDRFHPGNNP